MRSPAPAEVMGITNMLNAKGVAAAAQQVADSLPDHSHLASLRSLPEPTPTERSGSPHGSFHSAYSTPRLGERDSMPPTLPSPSSMHMHLPLQNSPMSHPSLSMPGMPPTSVPVQYPGTSYKPNSPIPSWSHAPLQPLQPMPAQAPQAPIKAYPCNTCGKGFARRSDLARHYRIHTGDRPHACDYPGCGKMFIQRSALTVHQRVHTGEKPHICEHCGTRFSDSSSLARHRRTHLGTRPYKCPYANCQKTFTRRTTLTRHQNHHVGTIEEAAVATAAALASRAHVKTIKSEVEQMSSHGSPASTPSPGQRTISMSPSAQLDGMGLQRHPSDFTQYITSSSLPAHMRNDLHTSSPATTSVAPYNTSMRPTSHPTSYPPSTLEPSIEQHQSGPGSASGSPHMGSVGWQSPTHSGSPSQSSANGFMYPDPEAYPNTASLGQMYYNQPNQPQRPQSAEPRFVPLS